MTSTLRDMLVKQEPNHVSYCFVCAGSRAEYTIFSKPYGDHPFFPFLEHHQPPEGAESMRPDGRVVTCFVCYTFLTQQWEQYERNKTPQSKRIYWLKRLDGGPFAGMDVNLQQDYESLFETSNAGTDMDYRTKQKCSRSPHITTVDIKPKLNECSERTYTSAFNFTSRSNDKSSDFNKSEIPPRSNILDLSHPEKPATENCKPVPAIINNVCYMCGEESKTLIQIFAKQVPRCPFFPSVMLHKRPPNAKPMDKNGKVYSCDVCFKFLIRQWDFFQRKKIPHEQRIYQIRKISDTSRGNKENLHQIRTISNTPRREIACSQQVKSIPNAPLNENARVHQVQAIVSVPRNENENLYQVKTNSGAVRSEGECLNQVNATSNAPRSDDEYLHPVRTISITPVSESEHLHKVKTIINAPRSEGEYVYQAESVSSVPRTGEEDLLQVNLISNAPSEDEHSQQVRPISFAPNEAEFPHQVKTISYAPSEDELSQQVKTISFAPRSEDEYSHQVKTISFAPRSEDEFVHQVETISNAPRSDDEHFGQVQVITTSPRSEDEHLHQIKSISDTPRNEEECLHQIKAISNPPKCDNELVQQIKSNLDIPKSEVESLRKVKLTLGAQKVVTEPKKSFVCYTCGMVAQLSVRRFIHAYPEKKGDPFFSFLVHLNPHPGANKLENGKAAVCSLCFKTLLRQLKVYELSNTSEDKRKYKILNEVISESCSPFSGHLQNQESDTKYDCYLCESSTESLVVVHTLDVCDMYFPFITTVTKPPNACPIDSEGRVRLCQKCYDSLTYQFEIFKHANIPIEQRVYKINSKFFNENKFLEDSFQYLNVSDANNDFPPRQSELCSLCECYLPPENACYVETVPRDNNMYFPSILMLLKPNTSTVDQFGRVLSCNQCRLLLKNQWEVFETARVPHSQRQYEIFPPEKDDDFFNGEIDLLTTNSALHVQVSSPDLRVDLSAKHSNIEPLLTTVNTFSVTTVTPTNASSFSNCVMTDFRPLKQPHCNVDESIPRITGPMDVPLTRPFLLAPIYCFVCTELNVSGLTYTIKSLPTTPVGIDKPAEEVPFFPFLTKHTPPEGEKLRNDSSALACMFCYYSLISQWLAYESSPYPEDGNRWHRRYNINNYVCYICGITTYRKRVCTISVKDFPFLLEHSRPPGALTVLNGECVVTCQTCFESITSQWKDFERMKVPVEMRKYNWIVLPPPADDENSRGCHILSQENSGSDLSQAESDQMLIDDSGIPSGIKPPPSHLAVPSPYALTKPVGRNVISPVHQSSHSNSVFSPYGNNVNQAINATRTSSFAAALRKLAKAVEPGGDKDLSPISPASSPASNQQPSHPRHHAPLPAYLNSHSSNPSGHRSSPPVVAVTPIQSSQGKPLDLGRYSNNSRNGNMPEPVSLKVDNSRLSVDKRSESIGNKHLSSTPDQLSLRHEHNMPSRGFQPYRNSDERHSTPPQLYNPSPPPTTMSSYPYHSSFAQSSQLPHPPYRLEETVYMERYGLLRPSAMPYPPPSSNMLSHPRASLYPASHYPPELIPQSMRPAPPSSSVYPSRYAREEESMESNVMKKQEMEAYREHERYLERKEEREYRERELEYLRKERNLRQSPVHHPHSTTRTEYPLEDKGHMGSITHGTPRDYVRRMTPPPASVPLNLATHVMNAENELALEEEMNAKMSKYRNKAILNGQVHHRNASHPSGMSYRKESDSSSYKFSYQINENHSKPPVTTSKPENSVISGPSKPLPSYYSERDHQKSDHVETRTLSMASVINSQINGIFAREKFVSNNSYDYLNSFCDKNLFSDHTPKTKSESKITHSVPETYASHSKSSISKAPSQESSKYDSSSSKLPSFLLSDHSENSNYPPLLRPQESSITRALLQNPIVTSYENDVRTVEEPLPNEISVLDKREEKLRNLRKAGEMLDSDYSDPDSDEEDVQKLKKLLKIAKGPQPKFVPDPKQTKFLSNFRLISHSKKELIELKKSIRRHQLLREKSCSPVFDEPVKSSDIEYDPKHLSELAKRLCLEEDFTAKTEFLKMLGLMYVPPEQKAEKEKMSKVVETEKLRRNGILAPSQRCLELQGSHLGKRASNTHTSPSESGVKKPNVALNSSEGVKQEEPVPSTKAIVKKNPAPLKPFKSPTSSVARVSAFLKPPLRSVNLPVPPLIPASQVIPSTTEPVRDPNASVVAPKDPRVRQLNKEFALEFHNSVLQTTQMQLGEKKQLPSSVHLEPPFQKPSSTSSTFEKTEVFFPEEFRPAFRWPGIEAIMESYECHISEQNTERTFLVTNCQNLKAVIQESNTEIECLGHKTEELIHEQKALEMEKRDLQSKVEALGLFIQHFR